MLGTKEGSIKAVQRICDLIGVDFDPEKMLTWEALQPREMQRNWVAPLSEKGLETFGGFFMRVNGSTQFEDTAEREVDLEALKKTRPEMIECIEECSLIYSKVLRHPKAKFLVSS